MCRSFVASLSCCSRHRGIAPYFATMWLVALCVSFLNNRQIRFFFVETGGSVFFASIGGNSTVFCDTIHEGGKCRPRHPSSTEKRCHQARGKYTPYIGLCRWLNFMVSTRAGRGLGMSSRPTNINLLHISTHTHTPRMLVLGHRRRPWHFFRG